MASSSDWDEKYRRGEHAGAEPSPILRSSSQYWNVAPNQLALDLACGAGRNAVYLASNGWTVRAVDLSEEALRQSRSLALNVGVTIETSSEDIEAPGWSAGESQYGLIVVARFLHRPLFPAIRKAVAPGGLVVYETYTIDQLAREGDQLAHEGGPRNPQYLLQPNELLEKFRDWRVLRYEETWEGRATAALIARKPTP